MFISEIKLNEETRKLLNVIKKQIVIIPAHFEFVASVNETKFKLFLQDLAYIHGLKKINKDYFAFIRLYIAFKEGFTYCKIFNTKLLLGLNYTQEQLNNVKEDIINIPFDNKHKILAKLSVKAIYDNKNFTKKDIDILYKYGWDDEYIYASIDHTALLFKQSKIISAYLK